MTMIARKCADIIVEVVDINAERIAAWNSSRLPVFEPGLDEIVRAVRGKICFQHRYRRSNRPRRHSVYFRQHSNKNVRIWRRQRCGFKLCGRLRAQHSKSFKKRKIVVEKSTMPVRTADVIKKILAETGLGFQVLSNPEFLAEGTAMRDLENPDRVLIGGDEDTEGGRKAIGVLASVYERWVSPERIIRMNLWSSELSKLTANAFLAQRISSINAISALCEATGADVEQVARAVGADSRIGSKFLNSSVGYGGSCFQKDLLNLIYLCEHFNLPQAANYWRAVVDMNAHQKTDFPHW